MTQENTAANDSEALDREDWPWLAQQLRDWPEKRTHPERTMSIASLHRMAAKVIDTSATSLATLQSENQRLREALTPSGDTKAAYMGEFSIRMMVPSIDEDDDELVPHSEPVPWTTIKEIMAAIRKRADHRSEGG